MATARIAVYLSRHGYGHLVRAAAVLERLAARMPVALSVVAPQPPELWPASLKRVTEWVAAASDIGVEQSDDVTVDAAATGAALERWLMRLPDIVAEETGRLRRGFDLVLGDVPPAAFEAAAAAGIPSVALANFSWDWIYRELGFDAAAQASASMYARAGLLLETAPSAPMDAFTNRRSIGLVARRPAGRRIHTRARLGAGAGERLVLIALRPDSSSLLRLPPPLPGVRYLLARGWPGDRVRSDVTSDCAVDFLDLLEAADVVVGKPGYGLIGDVVATATRLLWVARPGFPESAVLEAWLQRRSGSRRISAHALRSGAWSSDLCALLEESEPAPVDCSGAQHAAAALAACLE
ncbi:MAG: hypothetical protein HY899_03700 [Deltaproteobacteria bacterium]|nr:hypothetical protein [Deltaproteobacteria bacterium]